MLHLNKLHRTICGCKVWYFPYRPTGMRCNYTQHLHGLAWMIPTALWYSFVLLCVRRRTSRHVDDLKWCNLYIYTCIIYEWCGRGSRYGSKTSVRGIMNSSRRSTKGNCSFFQFPFGFLRELFIIPVGILYDTFPTEHLPSQGSLKARQLIGVTGGNQLTFDL